MGFMTTLGTHVRLQDLETIESLGKVRKVFRSSTYQSDSYLAGLRHLTRAKRNYLRRDPKQNRLVRMGRYFGELRHRTRREKFIRRFAQDCESFFRPTLFSESDHAFFTTVSELELMGLAAYLATHPRTLQVHWHLQFHFNLFDGRTPEYEQQLDVARAIQACFDAALSRVPYHAIHFYTTSDTLADQYNRLGVGEFEVLPYPVSPRFNKADCTDLKSTVSELASDSEQVDRENRRPLRLTCPGGVRREKGVQDYLQPLVDKIWEPHLDSGNIKIVVQRSKDKWNGKPKIELDLPNNDDESTACNPIEYLSHPLSDDDYIKFIQSSDCGLLFYDSRIYFSRRAGVLGELLSCGKPVIVPAGSWLSEQIQNPIFEHVYELGVEHGIVRQMDLSEVRCQSNNVPLPGGVVSFDQARHPFVLNFDRQIEEGGFSIGFDWHWPEVPGVFARVEVTEFDSDGNDIHTSRQVIGQRRELSDSTAFFPFRKTTSSVKVSLKNAFHDSNASVKNFQINTIRDASSGLPRGAVGIIAADQDDLSNCIDEFVKHYAHYKNSAEKFAETWSRQHQPKRTVARLISNQLEMRRAA